jgi:hypothetical protein
MKMEIYFCTSDGEIYFTISFTLMRVEANICYRNFPLFRTFDHKKDDLCVSGGDGSAENRGGRAAAAGARDGFGLAGGVDDSLAPRRRHQRRLVAQLLGERARRRRPHRQPPPPRSVPPPLIPSPPIK